MSGNLRKAWVFISVGDKRLYEGNDGYKDDSGRSYDYDSFVPNHKKVRIGDLIFLSNKKHIFGTSVIDSIETWQGTRLFNRCPVCDSSYIQSRVVKSPKYRCNLCHQEFDEPHQEEQKCVKYRAHYGGSFTWVDKPPLLDSVYINKGTQQSMREVNRGEAENILDSWRVRFPVTDKLEPPGDSKPQAQGSQNQMMPTGVRSSEAGVGSEAGTTYKIPRKTEPETHVEIRGSTQDESAIDLKVQDASRAVLYNKAQRGVTEIESAIFELLRIYPGGLTNAEIGRYLGIYFGHDGHEGHISRSLLSIMEKKGVVEQPTPRGPWKLI